MRCDMGCLVVVSRPFGFADLRLKRSFFVGRHRKVRRDGTRSAGPYESAQHQHASNIAMSLWSL